MNVPCTARSTATTLVGITGVRRDARVKIAHKATMGRVRRSRVSRARHRANAARKRDRARGAGDCKQLMLCVNEVNATAERLYASQGFVRFGTEPRSMFVDGRFYDEHHMVKTLG